MRNGLNASHTRNFNRLLVLEAIRQNAPTTRTEVARNTALSAPTVTYIVEDLIAQNFVVEIGRRVKARGQPPIEIAINAEGAYTIGLLIDTDSVVAVIVNLAGEPISNTQRDIHDPSPEQALSLVSETYGELLAKAQMTTERILGIGLVTMGPIDEHKGGVSCPPLLSSWRDVPLREQLTQKTGLPVLLANNATAAAIGEYWYGIGRNYPNHLFVHFGYGLGGGLFLDGKVHHGSSRNAAEFGHLTVEPDGLECPCGRRGCLETRVSLHALARDLNLRGSETITKAFDQRSAALMAWLACASQLMAVAIGNVDHLLDLDAVIIGGDLPKPVLAHLVDEVDAQTRYLSMRGRPHRATIRLGMTGSLSGALGAASLPSYDALAPAAMPAAGAL